MKPNVALYALAPVALIAGAHADVVTIEPFKDNTLFESATGATSNGIGDGLFAGTTNQGAAVNGRRTVIQFDVAAAVPAGATINSVSLTLQVSMAGGSGTIPMSLHTLSQDFGEGTSNSTMMGGGMGAPATPDDATWIHTFFPGMFWTTAGGDFNAAASAGALVNNGAVTWTSGQLATDVQAWVDDPATNFGWLLKADDESVAPSAKRFVSRESAFPGDRPALMIDFDPPGGTGTTFCNSLPNSTGSEALLSATGDPNSSLAFSSTPVPNTIGQFFYGPMALGGGQMLGDGIRCVGGMTTRILPFINAGMMMQLPNTASLMLDYSAPYAAGLTGTQYFQHWFRSGLATGTGSHTSSGLEITF